MSKSLLFFFLFFLLASFCLAENGCFINKDSPYFCSDIPIELAIDECGLYGCSLESTFFSGRSCSEQEMLQKCQENPAIVPEPGILNNNDAMLNKTALNQTSSDTNKSNFFLIFGALLFLGAIIYFLYPKLKEYFSPFLSFTKKLPSPEQLNAINTTPSWLNPQSYNPLSRWKQRQWQKRHKKQMDDFHRDEILSVFGPSEKKEKTIRNKDFYRLKSLFKEYKDKRKDFEKVRKVDHFAKLEELTGEIKKKEEQIVQTYQQIDPQLLEKQNKEELILKLREIARGQ